MKTTLGLTLRARQFVARAVVVALGAASLALAGCGSSTTGSSAAPQGMALNERNQQTMERIIAEVEPNLQRAADGTLALSTPPTRAALSPEALAFAQQATAVVNQKIAAGEVKLAADLTLTPTSPTRANANGVDTRWWGVTVHISSSWLAALINCSKMAGLSGAAAQFVRYYSYSKFVSGAAGVVVSGWLWVLDWCDRQGGRRGVDLNITWATLMWATPQ